MALENAQAAVAFGGCAEVLFCLLALSLYHYQLYLSRATVTKILLKKEVTIVLGENIKKAREEIGMKQSELADAVGVVQSAIVYFEKGLRNPSVPTLKLLARVLGKSIDELVK